MEKDLKTELVEPLGALTYETTWKPKTLGCLFEGAVRRTGMISLNVYTTNDSILQ